MPEGFYPLESIFLLLALMALARIPSLEALRYVAPGEWGKLIGLDRIPEVRTLRQKVSELCCERGRAERWRGMLDKQWMESEDFLLVCKGKNDGYSHCYSHSFS